MSKIIFLNGCSSSGKTSVVGAIQHLSNEPWLTFGIDIFFKAMPPKYLPFGEKAQEGIQFITKVDKEGFPIVEIQTGSYGKKVGKSIPKIIKQLADDGHNLIIDEAIWEEKDLENYHATLKNHQVYFIKITCDLSLMEEREKIRGDRAWGLARDQYAKMEKLKWEYELQIDTDKFRPFVSAKMILELIGEQLPQQKNKSISYGKKESS